MPAPRPTSPPTPSAILPTADDQIILADTASTSHLLRYNADFTLDTTFGQSGVAVIATPTASSYNTAFELAELPDGTLLAWSSAWAGGRVAAVSAYTADGVAVASFGQSGTVATGPTPQGSVGGTLLPNGSLLLAAGGLTAIRPPGYTERLYFTHDRLASVTATVAIDPTDASATSQASPRTAERYAYDPYGQRIILNGDFTLDADGQSDVASNLGLAGYHYDSETGLYYVRNRFYQSDVAVWLNPDPMGYVDSGNLSAYVASRPTAARDPMGLELLVLKDEAAEFEKVLDRHAKGKWKREEVNLAAIQRGQQRDEAAKYCRYLSTTKAGAQTASALVNGLGQEEQIVNLLLYTTHRYRLNSPSPDALTQHINARKATVARISNAKFGFGVGSNGKSPVDKIKDLTVKDVFTHPWDHPGDWVLGCRGAVFFVLGAAMVDVLGDALPQKLKELKGEAATDAVDGADVAIRITSAPAWEGGRLWPWIPGDVTQLDPPDRKNDADGQWLVAGYYEKGDQQSPAFYGLTDTGVQKMSYGLWAKKAGPNMLAARHVSAVGVARIDNPR